VPAGLTPENLTVSKEKTYFVIVLIVSIAVWLALAVSVVGAFYAAIFGVFLWVGNGLLTAHLRSSAVRVGPNQLPELDATFREVCAQLGLHKIPALYVLQSGGILNAFATRFAGREFVVVFSEFLEAIGPSSPEMRFILGHEIGHIQSQHVLKQIFVAPGLLCPLIGPAYRRAWETSCDRYGAYAAQDVDAAVRAMLILSGGREHGPRISADAFADQYFEERGFFISLHELTSTYPTLSRRVTDLMGLGNQQASSSPKRNPLAYIFAAFIPGGNATQGGPLAGLLVVVMMIGLLSAMAIPAFQKVRQAAEAKTCVNNQRMLAAALEQYRLENNAPAKNWTDVVGAGKLVPTMPNCPHGGVYSATYSEADGYTVSCSITSHSQAALAAATQPKSAR
jgi:Zn-dependent protease with chaperone function/competence protein ComGC